MNQISLESAILAAERYLNTVVRNPHDPPQDDHWIISKDKIKDCNSYWLFHYQSERYVTTRNPSYMLAGNLPLKMAKSGEILGFETPSLRS